MKLANDLDEALGEMQRDYRTNKEARDRYGDGLRQDRDHQRAVDEARDEIRYYSRRVMERLRLEKQRTRNIRLESPLRTQKKT